MCYLDRCCSCLQRVLVGPQFLGGLNVAGPPMGPQDKLENSHNQVNLPAIATRVPVAHPYYVVPFHIPVTSHHLSPLLLMYRVAHCVLVRIKNIGSTMEGYNYEAAAPTIKTEDITRHRKNRNIIRWLKEDNYFLCKVRPHFCHNDPDFDWNYDELVVVGSREGLMGNADNCYCPESARDLGWVGYFIGKNTKLQGVHLQLNPLHHFPYRTAQYDRADIEAFFGGVNSNRSIQEITFNDMYLSEGEIFQSLHPFFENNNNLSYLFVNKCVFGYGCAHQFSLLLRGCNNSLKRVRLSNNLMGDCLKVARLEDFGIIRALSMHPQLEKLVLKGMNVGRNECVALGKFLGHTTTELRYLVLSKNDIDDEGVESFVGALANCRLSVLDLSLNLITDRGCQSLAGVLQNPNSNLVQLSLSGNLIGNEGALVFANALARNSKLKKLDLWGCDVAAKGWSSFSKVLCDTSSVNKTFLSNHTLEDLGHAPRRIPEDVRSLLALNLSDDKKEVAIKKVLLHHPHFDMQPFFEWELRVLPIAVAWFERARSMETGVVQSIRGVLAATGIGSAAISKHRLEAIYQFIRAMPEVFEPATAAGAKRKRGAIDGKTGETL